VFPRESAESATNQASKYGAVGNRTGTNTSDITSNAVQEKCSTPEMFIQLAESSQSFPARMITKLGLLGETAGQQDSRTPGYASIERPRRISITYKDQKPKHVVAIRRHNKGRNTIPSLEKVLASLFGYVCSRKIIHAFVIAIILWRQNEESPDTWKRGVFLIWITVCLAAAGGRSHSTLRHVCAMNLHPIDFVLTSRYIRRIGVSIFRMYEKIQLLVD